MVEENFVVRARRYIAGWISPGPAPENPGNSPVEREAALAGNHTRYLTVAVQDLQNGRTVFEAGVLRALEGYQANVLEELGRFRADQTAHTERLDKRYAEPKIKGKGSFSKFVRVCMLVYIKRRKILMIKIIVFIFFFMFRISS